MQKVPSPQPRLSDSPHTAPLWPLCLTNHALPSGTLGHAKIYSGFTFECCTLPLESGSNSTMPQGLAYHILLNSQEQRRENTDPKGSHRHSALGSGSLGSSAASSRNALYHTFPNLSTFLITRSTCKASHAVKFLSLDKFEYVLQKWFSLQYMPGIQRVCV